MSQIPLSVCRVSCLRSHIKWVFRCQVLGPTFRVLGRGSCVPNMGWVPGLGSWVAPLGCQVSGPGSHPQDGSRVWGLGSHQKSMVLGSTFQICRRSCNIEFVTGVWSYSCLCFHWFSFSWKADAHYCITGILMLIEMLIFNH